jgi:hypothetical protein
LKGRKESKSERRFEVMKKRKKNKRLENEMIN